MQNAHATGTTEMFIKKKDQVLNYFNIKTSSEFALVKNFYKYITQLQT